MPLYYRGFVKSPVAGFHRDVRDFPDVCGVLSLWIIKYFLGILAAAYRELDERLTLATPGRKALDVVRDAIDVQFGSFTKTRILELCTTLSPASVERSLKTLCDAGELRREGQGRSTRYSRRFSPDSPAPGDDAAANLR